MQKNIVQYCEEKGFHDLAPWPVLDPRSPVRYCNYVETHAAKADVQRHSALLPFWPANLILCIFPLHAGLTSRNLGSRA